MPKTGMKTGNNPVDIHTHILPGVDDGSKDAAMSADMLCEEKRQGVKTAVMTPHFYAEDMTPSGFTNRRARALDELKCEIKQRNLSEDDVPEIILGAEVRYFDGMSVASELCGLTIGGTEMLLLEMPFSPWTERMFGEIYLMRQRLSVVPVIAHLDRYINLQNKKSIGKLLDSDVLVSINAESFFNRKTAKWAMKLIENQRVQFIGSDCHNLSDRAPDIGGAVVKISDKIGDEPCEAFCNTGNDLIIMAKRENIFK